MPRHIRLDRRAFLKKLLIVAACELAACQSPSAPTTGAPDLGKTSAPAQPGPSPAGSRPTEGPNARPALLFIGTYAEEGQPGIYSYRLDPARGALAPASTAKAGANPSFLALHPTAPYLYAVNEIAEYQGQPSGAVGAFAIDPASGALSPLNRQPSGGIGPCHLATDRTGRFLVVANYGDGTLAAYPLGADGRIGALSQMVQHRGRGANPERQEGPHAHFVAFAPDNRFALSCDLGIDKVLVYRFTSADGQLEQHGEAALPPGAGPRHLEVHPNGRYAYVISELNATLTVFSYAAESGKLAELQTISTLPADYSGPKSAAEVLAHPSGRFVYASNRGHNSIAMFAADEASGTLTWLGHASTRGETPRSFAIDPAGAFLLAANQDSDTVASFRIDAQSGMLQYLQSIAVPKPVCLTFRR